MARIQVTEAYLINLRNYIEPEQVLRKHGYVGQPLTDDELLLKRRCLGCMMSQLRTRPRAFQPLNKVQLVQEMPALSAQLVPEDSPVAANPTKEEPGTAPVIICRFHEGPVKDKSCESCGQHITAKACGGSPTHNPASTPLHQLRQQYQFHSTPNRPSSKSSFRSAVALDCEMGMAVSGDSEIVRLTLIDYFSGEVLINHIVKPKQRLEHLNTRFSGVTWAEFNRAVRQRTALHDKEGARHAIWQFVGLETVVVGHGACNDLRALRWIHPAVVDSQVIEFEFRKKKQAVEEAGKAAAMETKDDLVTIRKEWNAALVGIKGSEMDAEVKVTEVSVAKPKTKEPGSLTLKALAKKRLGRDIQMGRKGHDSLEDAVAARDLVHWYLSSPNQELW